MTPTVMDFSDRFFPPVDPNLPFTTEDLLHVDMLDEHSSIILKVCQCREQLSCVLKDMPFYGILIVVIITQQDISNISHCLTICT